MNFTFSGNLKKTAAKEVGKRSVVEVEVLSLEDAYDRYMRRRKIFMLKTDVEGFDGNHKNFNKAVIIRFETNFQTENLSSPQSDIGFGDSF